MLTLSVLELPRLIVPKAHQSPPKKGFVMTVAKVTEISSSSTVSFEDAIKTGIARAAKTLQNIKGAWVKEQSVDIENDKITQYRVNLMITFVLKD